MLSFPGNIHIVEIYHLFNNWEGGGGGINKTRFELLAQFFERVDNFEYLHVT